jgi:hypothetical protein
VYSLGHCGGVLVSLLTGAEGISSFLVSKCVALFRRELHDAIRGKMHFKLVKVKLQEEDLYSGVRRAFNGRFL